MKQNHPPLIESRNLTVIKGLTKKVLDSINLTINIGENVAIIGPNGSGKSSLIKTITREYYPVSTVPDMVCRIWGQEVWNIFDLRYLLGIVSDDLTDNNISMLFEVNAQVVKRDGYYYAWV